MPATSERSASPRPRCAEISSRPQLKLPQGQLKDPRSGLDLSVRKLPLPRKNLEKTLVRAHTRGNKILERRDCFR